ncbi:MAG: SH3 domain-containing protein [bacterium]|nr:SH3 domain-containing protein [bacterium]
MHNRQWEAQIPFYVAGTLTSREARAVEQHLIGCETCRAALRDWQAIASAVRTEAASHMRDLPPLSPALIAHMHGDSPMLAAPGVYPPRLPRESRGRGAVRYVAPLTLTAAAGVVIAFGMLLANLNSAPLPTAGTGESSGVEVATFTPTPTVDLMATIAVMSTQYADGTRDSDAAVAQAETEAAVIIVPAFATNTPNTPVIVLPGETVPGDSGTLDTPVMPQAIVNGDAVNMRGGPGTDYAVIGTAEQADRFPILARAGSGADTWLLVETTDGLNAWVYGALVSIDPPNAQIAPAATIPPRPPTLQPTQTPAPTITAQPPAQATNTPYIRDGAWTHVTTGVEDSCGAVGNSISQELILVPSADRSSVTLTYLQTGISFTVYRVGGLNYAGNYNLPEPDLNGSATISVQLSFEINGMAYTGQETVNHANSCLTRSLWAGRAR